MPTPATCHCLRPKTHQLTAAGLPVCYACGLLVERGASIGAIVSESEFDSLLHTISLARRHINKTLDELTKAVKLLKMRQAG